MHARGLLREMRKFDGKKNADRISALIVGMFMLRERSEDEQQEQEQRNDFYSRPLYGNEYESENERIDNYSA